MTEKQKSYSKYWLGKKFSEEHRNKLSSARKLNPSKYWLGKKFSEEHRNKLSSARKLNPPSGMASSPEKELDRRKKISYAMKNNLNKNNWLIGRKCSFESKMKMSLTRKELFRKGEIKIWATGKTKENDNKVRLMSEKLRGHKVSIEARKKISDSKKGDNNPAKRPDVREKIKRSILKLFENNEFREKNLKARLKGLMKRPTSLEDKMIKIINENNLPYKYSGDGSFIIGFKNPDFINTTGMKTCIETRPKKMCLIWNKESPEEYSKKQINHYAKYGWKCIVIWQEDLENKENIIKLLEEKHEF